MSSCRATRALCAAATLRAGTFARASDLSTSGAASGTPGALPQIEPANRGWKGPVYQTQGVANNDYLRVGGNAVEGSFMTTAPMLVAEQLADTDPIKKPAMEYVTKFEAPTAPTRGRRSSHAFGATCKA
ncbi:MAG: hypothetical protein ABI277_11490 [Burkholderiaceae bacterium]